MSRDDFSRATIQALAQRVAWRCSNPQCRTATAGPHSASDKAISVGVAAHITAASAGGPRFDTTLTPEQRISADNGIWLCATCARLIDTDAARFATSVLHGWKAKAELTALQELGSKSSAGIEHSIRFSVSGWQMWLERGNAPNNRIVVLSIWGPGDVRYACTLRMMNLNEVEEHLYAVRVEWRKAAAVVFSDEYAFQGNIVLVPKKWKKLHVSYGLHKSNASILNRIDSVWLTASAAGEDVRLEWKLADVVPGSILAA